MNEDNKAPEGMFVFSKPVKHPLSLRHWIKWFSGKGIKTEIITNKYGQYLLCREGVEAV